MTGAENAAVPDGHAQLVASFLEYACPDHHIRGRPAHAIARNAAMRILRRNPEIAHDSIYTAVVCGELEEVERILWERPEAALQKSSDTAPDRAGAGGAGDIFKDIGPKGWEPLSYLCFARLPGAKAMDNAVAIARLLLDHGADPNVYFMAGDSRYTPLVGVIGEGEENRPPHAQRETLTRLLLERGAEPYDMQVIYNIHFRGKVLWYMKLMYEFAVKAGQRADWDDPEWRMLDMGGYGSGARWHLEIAVQNNDPELAEWCLAHGASPNAAPARDTRRPQHSLYEHAMRLGHVEMAELLARYGAQRTAVELEPEDEFVAACLRLDRAEVNRLLDQHPEYLRSTKAIFAAAKQDRADVVGFLLDVGMPIEIEHANKQRPLHIAAMHDAMQVAALLIERGAEIDPVEQNWNNTPLDFAVYHDHPRMIELLTRYSREVGNLVFTGKVERLREILRGEPQLATIGAPLFWLPDDETNAVEIVELFLANGADAGLRRKDGTTAADVARRRGLDEAAARLAAASPKPSSGQPYAIRRKENRIVPWRNITADEWDVLIGVMKEQRIPALQANRLMTDAVLERIAQLDHVTRLSLGGSLRLTDDGLKHLARMPQLQHLELNEYPGGKLTDRGLDVLRELPELRTFEMTWQAGISDAGVANLRFCDHLESVDLMGTPTGDGAILALARKPKLRRFKSGRLVTDAGLSVLREFPMFKNWHGGEIQYSLMGAEKEPTHLLLDGPFTNAGLASLAGLKGLCGLSFFWHVSAMTADGLKVLAELPNLASLGCQRKLCDDTAMRYIAALPGLRRLMAQGTVATDDGFAALARSKTIEYIWGRECPNLTGRGFAALATMPALRGLGVSCKQVDDDALSKLPQYQSLRELMPMDVQDAGFRHAGRCERLERLWMMYCRDTTDVATEHIAGLHGLKTYYAGKTRITDRSLEILGGMSSLERLEFYECEGITEAGLVFLATLPRLREVALHGLPNVTLGGTAAFPAHVDVDYSVRRYR